MSLPVTTPEAKASNKGRFGPDGRDRRRRHRAKVAMPVHIRGGAGSAEPFSDSGRTIDVSRDGLLISTKRDGYWDGEIIDVTIACVGEPTETDTWLRARVVRSTRMPNLLSYGLALEYQTSQTSNIDPAGPSKGQRRKLPRYNFIAISELIDLANAIRLSGRVTEISLKGCYVDTLNSLPVGTILNLRISRDQGSFVTQGKVIYVHDNFGMGVLFLDPPEDQVAVLDSWLSQMPATALI